MAATAQGSAELKLRWSRGASEPAGVPQRWQNLAPGASAAPHAAQFVVTSVAPQFEQNLPEACLPHDGQVDVGAAAGVVGEFIVPQS